MRWLYEVFYLVNKGCSLLTACRVAHTRFTMVDHAIVVMFFGWMAYGFSADAFAQYEYRLAQDTYTVNKEKHDHSKTKQKLMHREATIVSVLNGEGVIENGKDRPCKCGEYRNGRDWYKE